MTQDIKTVIYSLGTDAVSGSNIVSNWGGVAKCWNVTVSGGTWSDKTTEINNATANDVSLGVEVGDALYIGCAVPFVGSYSPGATTTVGGSGVGEYWNGSAWTAVPSISDHRLVAGATINWSMPTDWATTQVNGESDGPHYYFRLRVVTKRTTGGTTSWFAPATIQQVSNSRTITIPETTNRTIKNAILRLNSICDDNGQAGFAIVDANVRFGATDYSVPDSFTKWAGYVAGSTSKKFLFTQDLDVTTLARTAFTSATSALTFDAKYAYSMNVPAGTDALYRMQTFGELYVTYEHDDTDATQLNTVIAGSPSLSGVLTTTHQQIGTIPQITGVGGLLQESNIVIKDFYIMFEGNIDEDGTTDWDFYTKLDSETETLLTSNNSPLTSDAAMKFPWRRMDIDFGSSHSVSARVTNTAGAKFPNIACKYIITYTFDGSSTLLTKTIETPFVLNESQLDGTINFTDVNIHVPVAITAANNFANIVWMERSHNPITIGISGFNSIVYKNDQIDGTTSMAGVYAVNHQMPNISAGFNKFTFNINQSASTDGTSNVSGIIYSTFNYTKSASGKIINAKTFNGTFSNTDIVGTNTYAYTSPVTGNYYMNSFGIYSNLMAYTNFTNFSIDEKILNNVVNKYKTAVNGTLVKTAYTQCVQFFTDYSTLKFPEETNSLNTNPVPSGSLRVINTQAFKYPSFLFNFNYHTFRWTVSGTISGSAGGTIMLHLVDGVNNKIIQSTSRVGNGSYSFSHWDNTSDIYVVAVESDTLKGVSKQDISSAGSFDINLAGGGGTPTKHSYVWGS